MEKEKNNVKVTIKQKIEAYDYRLFELTRKYSKILNLDERITERKKMSMMWGLLDDINACIMLRDETFDKKLKTLTVEIKVQLIKLKEEVSYKSEKLEKLLKYVGLTEQEYKRFKNKEHQLLYLIISGKISSIEHIKETAEQNSIDRNKLPHTFSNSKHSNNLFNEEDKVKLVVKYCKANDIKMVETYNSTLESYGLL